MSNQISRTQWEVLRAMCGGAVIEGLLTYDRRYVYRIRHTELWYGVRLSTLNALLSRGLIVDTRENTRGRHRFVVFAITEAGRDEVTEVSHAE